MDQAALARVVRSDDQREWRERHLHATVEQAVAAELSSVNSDATSSGRTNAPMFMDPSDPRTVASMLIIRQPDDQGVRDDRQSACWRVVAFMHLGPVGRLEAGQVVRVLAVGIFDLLHAGHLHYLEQARALGDELYVVVAHDETVRQRKHEPVTGHELRRRMIAGLKPVDVVVVGAPPPTPIYDILDEVQPDIICLGYDQEHAEERIRAELDRRGTQHIELRRAQGLTQDLDGTRKIIARIIDLFTVSKALEQVESRPTSEDTPELRAAATGTEVTTDG